MKKTNWVYLVVLMVFGSCSKDRQQHEAVQPEKVHTAMARGGRGSEIDLAANSTQIAQYYTIAEAQARLTVSNPKRVATFDFVSNGDPLEDTIIKDQAKLVALAKDYVAKFGSYKFTAAETEQIFLRYQQLHSVHTAGIYVAGTRTQVPRPEYGYHTNCKSNWDDTNNECWKQYGWDSFWNICIGPLAWRQYVENVRKLTECSQAAEKEYYYCSGD